MLLVLAFTAEDRPLIERIYLSKSPALRKLAYSKIEMTLTIQVWSNGAYIDTSNSWTSSGSGATSIEKNIKLSQGNYRAKSVVKVYSSSGTYLETVTKYSADIVI